MKRPKMKSHLLPQPQSLQKLQQKELQDCPCGTEAHHCLLFAEEKLRYRERTSKVKQQDGSGARKVMPRVLISSSQIYLHCRTRNSTKATEPKCHPSHCQTNFPRDPISLLWTGTSLILLLPRKVVGQNKWHR